MQTIDLCINTSSYLRQARHCRSKVAAGVGENTKVETKSVKKQICGCSEKGFIRIT